MLAQMETKRYNMVPLSRAKAGALAEYKDIYSTYTSHLWKGE